MEIENIVVKKELDDEYESFSNNNIKCEEIDIKDELVDNEIVQTFDETEQSIKDIKEEPVAFINETVQTNDVFDYSNFNIKNEEIDIKEEPIEFEFDNKIPETEYCMWYETQQNINNEKDITKTALIDHDYTRIIYKCIFCKFNGYLVNDLMEHMELIHFKCRYCSHKADTKFNLSTHMNIKHKCLNKLFLCDLCDYKSVNRTNVHRHRATVHSKNEYFKCNYCAHKTTLKERLQSHIEEVHLKIKQFKCTLCNYLTGKSEDLRIHATTEHKKYYTLYKCDLCKFQTDKEELLKTHEDSVHTTINKFECFMCKFKTCSMSNLLDHRNKEHP